MVARGYRSLVKLPDDLLLPQPNPDIEPTLLAIQDDVAALLSEKDSTTRRGYARVLIAQLEHLDECEDPLPAVLREGRIEEPDDWLPADLVAVRGLKGLSERPFDRSGSGRAQYFIEFNGRLSRFFTDLPEDDGPFLGFAGPWVFVHRLEHTTATETARYVAGTQAFARVSELAALDPDGPRSPGCRLMIDPAGYSRSRGAVPSSLVLGTTPDRSKAVAAADELSEALGIRLLVATPARLIDNH